MNVTKIILRKPRPEPGQAAESVHYLPTSTPEIPSAAAKLGADYKLFKQEHPAKWARLPPLLKAEALALVAMGVSPEVIAEACGVHTGTVLAWLKREQQGDSPKRDAVKPSAQAEPDPKQPEPSVLSSAASSSPTDGDRPMDAERVRNLGVAYKAFKQDNPERWARLPESIKAEALALLQSGTTAEMLATACGIHTGSVLAWARPRTQPVGRPRKRFPEASSVSTSTDQASPTWVRVRVRGTEVEVNEADFLRLFT